LPKKKKTEKKKLKTEAEIKRDLEKLKNKILEKYGDIVKCIIMMGSVARGEYKPQSDIDVFLVIDDTEKPISPEEKDKIDEDIEKIASEISEDISIQPSIP